MKGFFLQKIGFFVGFFDGYPPFRIAVFYWLAGDLTDFYTAKSKKFFKIKFRAKEKLSFLELHT